MTLRLAAVLAFLAALGVAGYVIVTDITRGFAVTDLTAITIDHHRFEGGPYPQPEVTPETSRLPCDDCGRRNSIDVHIVQGSTAFALLRAVGWIDDQDIVLRGFASSNGAGDGTVEIHEFGHADVMQIDMRSRSKPPAYSAALLVISGGDYLLIGTFSDDLAMTRRNLTLAREMILPQILQGA